MAFYWHRLSLFVLLGVCSLGFATISKANDQNETYVLRFVSGAEQDSMDQFVQTLELLQSVGISRVIIEPTSVVNGQGFRVQNTNLDIGSGSGFNAVSVIDEEFPAGDFYMFESVSNSDKDENIRMADYKAIYGAVRYLSEFRFRVIVQLSATILDLRSALQSTRPAIILWSGHGNEKGFYDARGIRVPYDIFQNASQNVYQVIIAACLARDSLSNLYKIPESIRYWGWSGLTTPAELQSFLNSAQWDAFMNRKAPIVNEGLTCNELGEIQTVDGKTVFSRRFEKMSQCYRAILNANEGFVCVARDAKFVTASVIKGELTPGDAFDTLVDCNLSVSSAYHGKLCRLMVEDKKVHKIDAQLNAIDPQAFENVSDCVNSL